MGDVVRIYPEWKNAVSAAAERFQYGDLIDFEWLHKNFDIQKPTKGTFDEFQEYQFNFLAAVSGFQGELLEQYQMALENVRGKGYRVLKPKDQTQYAEKRFVEDTKRSLKKAISILNNIKFDALTDAERKENADAKGRIAAICSMSKRSQAACIQTQQATHQ